MKGLKRGLLMVATVAGVAMLTSVQVNAAEINKNKENYERLLRSLFDGEWYASNYPDVVKVYGTDDDALFAHFMTYGITEGRDINAVFDVEKYKEANPDLAEQFGDDYAAYYEHYVTYGQAEQRPLQIEGNNSSNDYMLLNEPKSNDSLDDELEEYMEYQRLAREKGIDKYFENENKIEAEFYDACNKIREDMKATPFIDVSDQVKFNQEEYASFFANYKGSIEDFTNSYSAYKEYAETNLYDLNEVKKQVAEAKQDGASREQIENAKKATENVYNIINAKREKMNDIITRSAEVQSSENNVNSIMSPVYNVINNELNSRINYPYMLDEIKTLNYYTNSIGQLDTLLDLYDESSFWNSKRYNAYLGGIDIESKDYQKVIDYYEELSCWSKGYYNTIYDVYQLGADSAYRNGKGCIESLYSLYNKFGAISEKHSDKAIMARLDFEASPKTKAAIKLREDYSEKLDESFEGHSKRNLEYNDLYNEVDQYRYSNLEKNYSKFFSVEDRNYIRDKSSYLTEKNKELKQLLSENASELDMATFLKNEADSLVYNESGENTDPETPGEVVNPEDPGTSGEVVNPEDPGTSGEVVNPEDPGTSGEVVNPEDPGTSGEVVNPEDPGTSGEVVNPEDPGTSGEVVNPENPGTSGEIVNPEKPGNPSVTISVNGNITITVVDEHTISIDFDGHIEAKCAG